jgi:hypothetical protein
MSQRAKWLLSGFFIILIGLLIFLTIKVLNSKEAIVTENLAKCVEIDLPSLQKQQDQCVQLRDKCVDVDLKGVKDTLVQTETQRNQCINIDLPALQNQLISCTNTDSTQLTETENERDLCLNVTLSELQGQLDRSEALRTQCVDLDLVQLEDKLARMEALRDQCVDTNSQIIEQKDNDLLTLQSVLTDTNAQLAQMKVLRDDMSIQSQDCQQALIVQKELTLLYETQVQTSNQALVRSQEAVSACLEGGQPLCDPP